MNQSKFYLAWLIIDQLNKQNELDIVYNKVDAIYSLFVESEYNKTDISELNCLKSFVSSKKVLINEILNLC
tara:strand:+ start:268 stop:480 length:213 start_codon:yes stop_codon:yes gene_type:complete